MPVSENLKERRERIDDQELLAVVDEALENQDEVAREVEEPTLKHGTDTINYDGILNEGLVPGSENSSGTGESGDGDDVAFSTSFPVALRYGELTEARQQNSEFGDYVVPSGDFASVEHPMVIEVPVSEIEEASIDRRNGSAVESVLGVDVNPRVAPTIVSYIEEPEIGSFYEDEDNLVGQAIRGDEDAGEVVKAMLSDTYGDVEVLRDEDVFQELSHDEVNGDFLQEVNTPYAPVNSEATVYVPASEIDEYKGKASENGFQGNIHSLEARALVHEERMKDVYREDGTVNFEHPADSGKAVNFFGKDGKETYNESPEVIDISRLRGESVYDNTSRI